MSGWYIGRVHVGNKGTSHSPNDAPGKGSLDTGDRDLIRILERRVSSLQAVDRSQR